jgi:membrane protein DedA with SNARE-associated domain
MHSLRCGTNSGVESFLTHAGYGALILFAFVQACSIPISSEITFGFAGVLAAQGHLSLPLVIVLGTLAELAGSSASYAVGRRGGRPAVERLGRFVLITGSDIDRAERFFDGRGAWAVAVGRVIPLVRAFIGLAAGMIEIPALPFGLFNLLGTAIWATALSVIGYAIGSSWTGVAHAFSLAGYVLAAAFVLSVAAMVAYRLRAVRKEAAGKAPAGPAA